MLLLPIPRLIKRTMDLILGSIIAVLLFPLMVLIALGVKLTSPGRIFYQQTVPGVAGRRFCMWKFRTMYVNGNQILAKWLNEHPESQEEWIRHHKLRNDPRVTPFGRFLRRTSLDELPQLLNVLRGDMSLVGPRPYPLYECDEMQAKAPLVLRIRPGITGLWQVSGRSNMTFEQRLVVDTKYVRNWSLWIDLAILAKTLIVVARKKGAY
jgi:Undecaprenyl-phosphate galactose phosphotransferase WbaP